MADRRTLGLVLWSFAIAIFVVSGLWLAWLFGRDWLRPLTDSWLFTLYAPSVLVAALVDGNVHQLDSVILFVAMVIQTSAMILLIFGLIIGLMQLLRPKQL